MSAFKGKYRLSGMELDFVSLVPAGDDGMAQIVISKADGTTDPQEEHMDPISKDDLAPEVAAYVTALEDEVDTLEEQVTKAEADATAAAEALAAKDEQIAKMVPATDEDADAISKDILSKADPAIKALIEKQAADLKAVEEIAKAEKDARLNAEYIAKAEALPMVGDDKAALGGLLRRAADSLSPEDNEALHKVLKSANEAIAQGNLFETFGGGGAQTTISASAEAARDAILKADPNLTPEQAIVKAYEDNPALFTEAMTQEG